MPGHNCWVDPQNSGTWEEKQVRNYTFRSCLNLMKINDTFHIRSQFIQQSLGHKVKILWRMVWIVFFCFVFPACFFPLHNYQISIISQYYTPVFISGSLNVFLLMVIQIQYWDFDILKCFEKFVGPVVNYSHLLHRYILAT